MKKLLICFTFCFALSSFAQKIKESAVPAEVKESFTKNFSGSKATKWEKEGANFEAEFTVNKVESSALFDPKGALLETETEIPVTALPKAAAEYLVKNASGQKVKEASKITDAGGKITYEAEAGGADYIFDASGIFIKKEIEKNDKDDDKKK